MATPFPISSISRQRTLTDIIVNFLLCSVIGVIIYHLGWVPKLWISLSISYFFGVTSHLTTVVIGRIYPHITSSIRLASAWLISLLIGSPFAYWLLFSQGLVDQTEAFSKFTKLMMISFFFGSAVVYFFYSREQTFSMREALKEAELKQVEKDKALLQSQLKLLQSQIEPHFLFNTLANLKGLIHQDPDNASLLLDKLTDLLRQSLHATRHQDTTLGDELNFCEAYLSIQKLRLGSRLSFNIEGKAAVNLRHPLPSLLIQPLVENSLQHGIELSEEGGEISIILAMSSPDTLVIEVKDTGIGLSGKKEAGHGVGLTNIRSRLKTLYGEKGKLAVFDNDTHGVIARLEVPISSEGSR